MRTTKRNLFISMLVIGVSALFTNTTSAQSVADKQGQFHDDLLDHLVGKWNVTSVAHGYSSTAVIEAEWVLNHQYIRYHFISNDTIPWIHKPMEIECFVSYNHNSKRYVVLGMSVFGVDDFEGFCYASRNGNELKLVQKSNNVADPINIQRWTWDPSSKSWTMRSRPEIAPGKEGEVFLDMKLVAAKY